LDSRNGTNPHDFRPNSRDGIANLLKHLRASSVLA
jgi:hypothetical protein